MVQKTGNQKTTVSEYGNFEVLPEHDEALDDTQESNETHTRRTLEPEPTAETAGEKADTGKLKVKIESKQKGADISLNVLESKVDQGRYYDAESPAEIASINPWEDFDKPREAIEEQKIADAAATFGCALSVLMKIGSLHGLDVSTPKKLIDAVHSGNFPITPNATELTAITKLEEIYSAEGSSWKKAFTEQFWGGLWGQVVSSKETEVRGIPESAIHSSASQPSIAAANKEKADSGSLQNAAQNSVQSTPKTAAGVGNWLSQKWDEAKENPGTALLYTGIAAAGIYGLYKIAKYLLKDDGSKDGEKAGEKEEGGMIGKILKYVLGAGAIGGGAYGLFGLFRSLTAGAEGKIVDGAGSKIVDTIKEKLGLDDKHGETVKGLLAKGEIGKAIEAIFIGLDKEKPYHDAVAAKVKSEVNQAEYLTGAVLFTYKDKNFTEFIKSDPNYSWETLDEYSNSIMDIFKDIPGAGKITGGVYGMDAADQKKATVELLTYFKDPTTVERLKSMHINEDTTTVDEVLKMLLPAGSKELKDFAATQTAPLAQTQTPPPSAENSGVAAAVAGGVAAGTAAVAAGAAATKTTTEKGTETAGETSGVAAAQEEIPEGEVPSWKQIKNQVKDNTSDSINKRKEKMESSTLEGSDIRKRLAANASLLDGMPTMADITKAIDDVTKRETSLDNLKLKTKPEEWGPIDDKIDEIKEFRKRLTPLLPRNEAAAKNYLEAMESGNIENIQKAFSELSIVKDEIRDVLTDALAREGWAFLEQMMVVRGINIAWNFNKNWLNPGDLRAENAKYLYGKFWDTVKTFVGGSARLTHTPKAPPMELDEIERLTKGIQHDIEGFETGVDAKRSARKEQGQDFFKRYSDLEKQGVRIQTDISRRIKAADEALAKAMASSNKVDADAAMHELNRCRKASAELEAGVTHSLVEGWQQLGNKYGHTNLGTKPISIGQILETSINQEGYEGGLQQLRSCFKSVVKDFKKEHHFSLWNNIKPTKTSGAIYGIQMALGGYLLSDDQTTFTEGVGQSMAMATPVVGTYLDAKQAATGKEAFTGRTLDVTDRFISGGFAIAGGASDILSLCGLGFMGRAVIDGAKTVKGLSRLRKAQLMLEHGTDAGKLFKASNAYKLNKRIHMGMAAMAVGVIGTQVVTASVDKLAEVNIPEGFKKEVWAPLAGQAENIGTTLNAKAQKIKGM